jgi:hypothetical protein
MRYIRFKVLARDPCISISRQKEEPMQNRRYFDRNKLDGTIPDWLSALKLLQTLCVRPARMAAAQRVRSVPLGVRTGRVFMGGRHGCTSCMVLGYAARRWVPPAAFVGGTTVRVLGGSRYGVVHGRQRLFSPSSPVRLRAAG